MSMEEDGIPFIGRRYLAMALFSSFHVTLYSQLCIVELTPSFCILLASISEVIEQVIILKNDQEVVPVHMFHL
jgi:hypothetical protein